MAALKHVANFNCIVNSVIRRLKMPAPTPTTVNSVFPYVTFVSPTPSKGETKKTPKGSQNPSI